MKNAENLPGFENIQPAVQNTPLESTQESLQDMKVKLEELEVQKEALRETVKKREEQLMNLFTFIQASSR